jgi:hypothetical protein
MTGRRGSLVRARRDWLPRLHRRHLTNWTSVRKVRNGETTNELYAFLETTRRRGGPEAMPVIPTTPDIAATGMTAPSDEALKLRPLPDWGSPQF